MTTKAADGPIFHNHAKLQILRQCPLLSVEGGNPSPILLGQGVGSTNGMDNPILVSLRACWMGQSGLDTNGDGMPDRPWKVTLPVIDCGDGIHVGNCNTVVGAVEVNVLWITPNGNDPQFNNVPISHV